MESVLDILTFSVGALKGVSRPPLFQPLPRKCANCAWEHNGQQCKRSGLSLIDVGQLALEWQGA